jgi:hypothetical protein
MQVTAVTTPGRPDWGWRIVNNAGEIIAEPSPIPEHRGGYRRWDEEASRVEGDGQVAAPRPDKVESKPATNGVRAVKPL